MSMSAILLLLAITVLAFLITRCTVMIFMDKIGYDMSLAIAVMHIQDSSEENRAHYTDKAAREGLSINLKVRLLILGGFCLAFMAILMLIVYLIKDRSKEYGCYAMAVGVVISYIADCIREFRYRAEIVRLIDFDKDGLSVRRLISEYDDDLINVEYRMSMNVGNLVDDLHRGEELILLEVSTGDYVFAPVWERR